MPGRNPIHADAAVNQLRSERFVATEQKALRKGMVLGGGRQNHQTETDATAGDPSQCGGDAPGWLC